MVVHDVMQGGVVDLIVDAKVNDELVMRGDGLECERAEPGGGGQVFESSRYEHVWPRGRAVVLLRW